MDIIYEKSTDGAVALRLFTSFAQARTSSVRIHYHSAAEISLILRGHGKYKTKNGVCDIKDGDIFFFRPNEAHCITDIESGGMELLNLHASPHYIYTNFQNAAGSDYIGMLSSDFRIESNRMSDVLPERDAAEVRSLMGKLREELTERKDDFATAANNYISIILILFSRACGGKGMSENESRNFGRMLSAAARIDADHKHGVSLASLASESGYSKCYFSTVFKRCMGMSVWDYVGIKRIEDALFLIKTTEKSILEIALECGFNNTANFNKTFKRFTGMRPKDFRKRKTG